MHPASAPDAALANSGTHPCVQSEAGHVEAGSAAADSGVGQERLGHVARRRARYVARFIYWTCKHGSTKHAAWVCNYEGLYW